MNEKNKGKPNESAVEGEGSYTATHNYNAGLAKSIEEGKSDELAQKAKEAVDGPEGDTLRKAEEIGKAGHPKHANDAKDSKDKGK